MVTDLTKLYAIRIGDHITYRIDDGELTGKVAGWTEMHKNGKLIRYCLVRSGDDLVPLSSIVSCARAGRTLVFSED